MVANRVSDEAIAKRFNFSTEHIDLLRPKKGWPKSWLSNPKSAPPWVHDTSARDKEISARHANRIAQQRQTAEDEEAKSLLGVAARIVDPTAPHVRKVVIHSGPTNAGKTYDGLQDLIATGSGVYAAPLRMLAREAFEVLNAALPGRVGLVTGEERINEFAPIVAATTEAAPIRGTLLVLDEAHWLFDNERGWAWTRLLVAGRYERIRVACDPSAEATIRHLLADADIIETETHQRFTPLHYRPPVTLAQIPDKSAVVAFSRKSVLALSDLLTAAGRRPAALYGALPPDARRHQINRLITGDADIIVTTDVIGHGVNLPIVAVVFAETEKFDGYQRRPLYPWEVAQIAGRAGRRGHAEEGAVHALTGVSWAKPNKQLIQQGALIAMGAEPSRLRVCKPALRPTFSDLGGPSPSQVVRRLHLWTSATKPVRDQLNVTAQDTTRAAHLAKQLVNRVGESVLNDSLGAERFYRAITAPVDDDTLLVHAVAAAAGQSSAANYLAGVMNRARNPGSQLEALEAQVRVARDLRALTHAIGDLPHCTIEQSHELEQGLGNRIVEALKATKQHGYGVCASCGKPCAPWFTECDSCHRSYRNDYDDYGYGYGGFHSGYSHYPEPSEEAKAEKANWWRETREASKAAITGLKVGDTVTFHWKGYDRTGTITKVARTRVTVDYQMKTSKEIREVVLHAARVTLTSA